MNYKEITSMVVYIGIVLGCTVGILLIITGHLVDYRDNLDKLIGTLMVVAGLQEGVSHE